MPKKKTAKKTSKKSYKKDSKNFNIIFFPLILLLFVIVALGFSLWMKESSTVELPKMLKNKAYNTGTQYPISSWKTYTNTKYGFSIKYPTMGYIQDPECFKKGICSTEVKLSVCGNGIKADPWTKSSAFIALDNMLGIIVNDYNGSIEDFIISQGGNPRDFKMSPQNISNTNEAVYMTLNKESGMTPPVPVIETPSYIVKHGDYIYQLAPLQNFGSEKGCLPPAGTDANSFKSKYWDIPQSINFN